MGPDLRRAHEKEKLSPFLPPPDHAHQPSLWSNAKPAAAPPAEVHAEAPQAEKKPGLMSSLWEGAKGLGNKAYHGLTDWAFEGRDAHNGKAPSQEDINKDPSWRLMGPKETIYHDNNRGAAERKYVKDDPSSFMGLGGKEAVIDGDTGKPMEAGPYQATYNYVNPAKGGMGDHSLGGIGRNLGHLALDVIPYWFGGTVRGDEGTTFGQRMLGPENYKKAGEKWDGAKSWASDKIGSVGKGIKSGWHGLTGWIGGKEKDHSDDKEHEQ
jgi:hypothetical protein